MAKWSKFYKTYGKKPDEDISKRFPYESTEDPEYIKDRDETFRKNGNGWWINTGKSVTTNKGNREIRRTKK